MNTFAERLRSDLVAARYRPGEWLKQSDLETTYDANRFEVRIGLSELAARRLLEHLPNRGYRVVNPTDREREELYEVRTCLELAAARKIVVRAKPQEIEEFAKLVLSFEAAIETANQARLADLNFALHDQFYRMSGNDLLATHIRELRESGVPGRTGSWSTTTAIRTSALDHHDMLECLRRQDAEGLAHVIYRHLYRWREYAQPVA
jgi:DNA-binding GntR family transcriptional regulator